MPNRTIPKPPAHLPKHVAEKWSATYAAVLKQTAQEQGDRPEERTQHVAALKAANVHVRVAPPESYSEAAKMIEDFQQKKPDGWKIISHGTRTIGGEPHIQVVTVNGKKVSFPIPAKKSTAA
jgi:hypothetical protein